jgi:hypothetical protein
MDEPSKIITHDGPVNVLKSVRLLRVRAIIIKQGSLNFDGNKGSTRVFVEQLTVDDPRQLDGTPTDAFHLGGISGGIGNLKGTGLQRDLAKIGKGANHLTIGYAVGEAVAMELKPGMDPDHIPHQDGFQIMNGWNITIQKLDYTGGPDTQHAAFFCNPGGPGADDTVSSLIHDCVVLGGTIITKATGIALGACTRCGAKNMHIEAKYPFRKNEHTKLPVNQNNELIQVRNK